MADKDTALIEAPAIETPVAMFERFATDPNVDVEKLERLMQLYERGKTRHAEELFNAAMAAAQTEMRPVSTDASNSETHSRYASYAKLDSALRPIYTRHGFAISFDTGETTLVEYVRVLAYVSHRDGFSRTYKVDMPADGKGPKGGNVMSKTHAAGSAMSYGMRYLLKMIFNVAVGEDDDDGNRAQNTKPAPKAPDGYDDWLINMEAVAAEGWDAFKDAWNKSPVERREHLIKVNASGYESLKRRAGQKRGQP